jgi:DNA-directed RNA polymerase subunit M/transcription elongation factor TFIIS
LHAGHYTDSGQPPRLKLKGKNHPAKNKYTDSIMNTAKEKIPTSQRFPCHCCHKQGAVYWSEKRQSFICENCLKTFDQAIIARRNGMAVEQLSLC